MSRRAPSRGAERSGEHRLSQPTQPLSAQGSSNDPSAWRRQGLRYPSNSVAIKSGRRGGGGSLWQPHEFHLLPQSTCRGCVTRQVPGANGGSVWENNKQLDDSSSFPNKNGQNRKAWPFKALSRPLFPKPPRSLETCPPLFARAATRASQVLAQDPLFGRAGRGDETASTLQLTTTTTTIPLRTLRNPKYGPCPSRATAHRSRRTAPRLTDPAISKQTDFSPGRHFQVHAPARTHRRLL